MAHGCSRLTSAVGVSPVLDDGTTLKPRRSPYALPDPQPKPQVCHQRLTFFQNAPPGLYQDPATVSSA